MSPVRDNAVTTSESEGSTMSSWVTRVPVRWPQKNEKSLKKEKDRQARHPQSIWRDYSSQQENTEGITSIPPLFAGPIPISRHYQKVIRIDSYAEFLQNPMSKWALRRGICAGLWVSFCPNTRWLPLLGSQFDQWHLHHSKYVHSRGSMDSWFDG